MAEMIQIVYLIIFAVVIIQGFKLLQKILQN